MDESVTLVPSIELIGQLTPGGRVACVVRLKVAEPPAGGDGTPLSLPFGVTLIPNGINLDGGNSRVGAVHATMQVESASCEPLRLGATIKPDLEPGAAIEVVAIFFHGTRFSGVLRHQAVVTTPDALPGAPQPGS